MTCWCTWRDVEQDNGKMKSERITTHDRCPEHGRAGVTPDPPVPEPKRGPWRPKGRR